MHQHYVFLMGKGKKRGEVRLVVEEVGLIVTDSCKPIGKKTLSVAFSTLPNDERNCCHSYQKSMSLSHFNKELTTWSTLISQICHPVKRV